MGGREVGSPNDMLVILPGLFPGLDAARLRPTSPSEFAVEAGRTALVNLCSAAEGPSACGLVKEFLFRRWEIVPELGLELILIAPCSDDPNAPTTIGADSGAGTPPAVYGIAELALDLEISIT